MANKGYKILIVIFLVWSISFTVIAANLYNENIMLKNRINKIESNISNLQFVIVIIDYNNGTIERHIVRIVEGANNTVFQVTKAIAILNYTYYEEYKDVFINAINGLFNDPTNGLYWLFYVNGKLSAKGAMNTYVYGGDRIVWNYTKIS